MIAGEFHREIATVFGEVKAAETLARDGRIVDLDGLDARIATLCEAALDLAPDERRDIARVLGDLHGALDRLAAGIKLATNARLP